MGGQGFVPEDGEGALVEGSKEAKERREEHDYEQAGGAAPRAGMQGKVNRGAAPGQRLDRPGTTPDGTPGSGGRIDVERARRPGIEGLPKSDVNKKDLGDAGRDVERRDQEERQK